MARLTVTRVTGALGAALCMVCACADRGPEPLARTQLAGGAETGVWVHRNWTGPVARTTAAMATDPARGKVVLFGGSGGAGDLADTWELGGGVWTQRSPVHSPPPTSGASMSYDPVRKTMLLFGGNQGATPTNAFWEWNGTDWSPITVSGGPAAGVGYAMTTDTLRNRVVLLAGSGGGNGQTWEWDGTAWTQAAADAGLFAAPEAQTWAAFAFDPSSGKSVLFAAAGAGRPSHTWDWDGSVWTDRTPRTSICATSPTDRCCASCIDGQPINCATPIANDPNCQKPYPSNRYSASMAYEPTSKTLTLFGGASPSTQNPPLLADAWSWDGTQWTPSSASPAPSARFEQAAATDPSSSSVVVFGGETSRSGQPAELLNDLWAWNGTSWKNTIPPTGPFGPRQDFATAFAADRGKLVLFGGGLLLGDTWEWDGASWTNPQPAASPPPRSDHAMAYADDLHAVLLFGGWNYDGVNPNPTWFNDLWGWNGTSWTAHTPAHQPPPRSVTSLAYDVDRHRLVLFGGMPATGNVSETLNDTWEWDGTDWTQLVPANAPTARQNAAMVYEKKRKRTLLFGGTSGNTSLGDTWEWDGTNWTLVNASSSAPPAPTPSLAYDGARDRVLLRGPSLGSAVWEWDGTQWSTATSTGGPPVAPCCAYALPFTFAFDSARGRAVYFGGADSDDTWEYYVTGNACASGAQCDTGVCQGGTCVDGPVDGGAPSGDAQPGDAGSSGGSSGGSGSSSSSSPADAAIDDAGTSGGGGGKGGGCSLADHDGPRAPLVLVAAAGALALRRRRKS